MAKFIAYKMELAGTETSHLFLLGKNEFSKKRGYIKYCMVEGSV
jgi:hypothetical protein